MIIHNKIKSLIQHQGFRRYAANTSWMMAEQMLRMIAGLFVGIWVARYLGPEQFGLFSYVLAFTAIFAGIAKLGLDGILVRELIYHPEQHDIYLGTAFWLKVAGAALVMAVMAILVPFTSNEPTTNVYIFIIAAGLVFQSFEVVEFYFQSKVLAKVVSICKVVQLSLSSVIKVYLVINQAELFWFVCITALDTVSLAVSYYVAYRAHGNAAFFKAFEKKIAKSLLKDSWPLIFSSLVVMVYMRMDQIMIKEMLGAYELGVYSAAVRLSEAFYFMPTLITASLFPAILNAKKIDELEYKARMQKLYTAMIWIAILIALPVSVFSVQIVDLLYGPDYAGSSLVLVIHVWASIFVFLTVSSGRYLTAEGKTYKILIRNLVGMFLNLLLNLVMIPIYGVVGAAIATLFSWLFAGYLYDFFDKSQWDMARQKTKGFIGAMK